MKQSITSLRIPTIKRALILAAVLVLLLPGFIKAAAPAGFSTEVIAGGLNLPTTFDFAPDGRVFVAEKGGAVRIIKNGELLAQPFLTLSDINTYADRGLIGLALDPNFSSNNYVYLSYTYENSPAVYEGPKMARIVRVQANGDTMLPGSMEVLVGTEVGDAITPSCNDFSTGTDCIPSDSPSHSAGGLRFGPDGMLYATLGDGASFAFVDPNAYRAQSLDWLTGKVLRLNRDGTAPADNPFFTGNPNDNRSKVFAYGIRNSFRFNFRPSTGALYTGEVGWGGFEEINVVTPGINMGWPCREGFELQGGYQCTADGATDPLYVYPNDGAASIVGGAFAGAAYPAEYQDDYFFADFYRSDIFHMKVSADDSTVISVDTWYDDTADGPVSVQAGPDGSIYYLSIFNGEVRRIKYNDGQGSPEPPIARDDNTTALSGETIYIDILDNDSDPNDDPIYLNTLTPATHGAVYNNGNNTVTYVAPSDYTGLDTFQYSISDGALTDTATVTIDVRPNADPTLVDITHVSLTQNISAPVVGETTTFTTTLRNDGEAGPFLIDFELYDANTGTVVNSKVLANEYLNANETKSYTYTWTPQQSGDYWLSVGYMSPNWSLLHHWEDKGLQFKVLDRKPPTDDPVDLIINSITLNEASIALGENVSATVSITNTGGDGTGLVDIEVTDETATVVYMDFFDTEFFSAGETRTFTTTWQPQSEGVYYVDAGTFGEGWYPFMAWMWHGAQFAVTPASTSSPQQFIYDDSLSADWASWSWDTTLDYSYTSNTFAGSAALSVTYTAPWGGAYFRAATPFVKQTSTNLSMALSGSTAGGQTLQIKVIDTAGNILHEAPVPALSNGWTEFSLPLSTIGDSDQIAGVFIMGRSGQTEAPFLVDEVRFE